MIPATSSKNSSPILSAPTAPAILTRMHETGVAINNWIKELFEENKTAGFTTHFTSSKKLILEASKGLSGTALLLGVGPANDLPLEELCMQFNEVVLVDINNAVEEEVLKKISKPNQSKIRFCYVDLTGTYEALAVVLADIPQNSSPDLFWENLQKGLAALKRNQVFIIPKHSASFVCSSMLASQLSFYFMERVKDVYTQHYGTSPSGKEGEASLLPFINQLMEWHIQDLHDFVSSEGKVYFSTETGFTKYDTGTKRVIWEKDSSEKSTVERSVTELFKKVKSYEWTWYFPHEHPRLLVGHKVKAEILTPK